MIRGSDLHIKELILSLLIFSGFSLALFSQTKISGVINQYGHVNGIGTDYVIVTDPTEFAKFSPNDTVLLIQMKGASTYFIDLGNGTLEGIYGKPGKHEFLLIGAIDGGTNKITFKSNIINAFSIEGVLQIVKVPSFKNSAIVDNADLTCAPWDSTSKTGGVLTLIAGKTLFLNKNIDVSGKGFRGGAVTIGTGLCVGTDAPNLDKFEYNSGFSNSGYKGESPVVRGYQLPGPTYPSVFPDYVKGKGANFTGGGGGNGKFSGGGGGANYGSGGKGGLEIGDCFPTYVRADGGRPGSQLKLTLLDGGLFMGGGGGSSTYIAGTPTPGGNGGGIVLIICEEIKGNNYSILANGLTTSPVQASGNAGAGGGGGGGSVALYLQSFSTSLLTISANGGKGGNNAGSFGEGGGGGGGLIKVSIPFPATVATNVLGGTVGSRIGGSTGANGADGVKPTDFVAVLNGFLFNIIRSSVSDNQVDSVCSTILTLPKITGTKPIGGTGPYTYIWEKSYERTFASPVTLTNDADPLNYTPTAADVITPTDSVFFRRTITDSSIPSPLVDRSKFVKFTVHPKIQYNNIIANPDSICFGSDPQIIKQNGTDIIFPTVKSLQYIWQDSIVGGAWGAELAAHTVKEYDPNPSGGLTVTTWYRRFVKSGACTDKGAGSIVNVTVLNKIADNAFSKLNDTICFGGNTNLNTITGPTGGVPGKYTYEWESGTSSSTGPWTTIAGETLQTFDPDASVSLPVGDHFYRRKVLSGEQNACIDFTPAAVRKVWPVLANNIIKADQTIGYDSIPAKLVDSALPLGGGSGTYKYQWVKDTVAFPSAPGPNSVVQNDYQPPNLGYTVSFKRIVTSSVCVDNSNSVMITVDLPITNTITLATAALDTIYAGQNPGQITGSVPTGGSGVAGDYSYKWYKSLTGGPLNSEWTEITGSTLINFIPGILTQTTWFRRDVSSPIATPRSTYKSNFLKLTVLPKIQNVDVTAAQAICYGKPPLQLKGTTLTGGDGVYRFTWQDSTSLHTWQNITGFVIGDSANYKPPVLISDTRYRRIVYSGKNNCGSETSKSVYIKVNDLPTGTITSTTPMTICEGAKVPLDITLTGAPGVTSWTIVYTDEYSNKVTSPSITSVNTTLLASPVSGTSHTTFNYSLFSVQDNNGCLATSLTNTRKADVYKVPVANAGPDVSICGPKITLRATLSSGNGIWSSPTAIIPAPGNTAAVTLTIDSAYAGKNIQHKFIWKETNVICTNKDSVLITFDKRVIYTNAAGKDTSLYSFDNIMHLAAKPLELWESGVWTVVSGTGNFDDETKNDAIVSNLSKGLNTFKWAIKNGTCALEDILNISVYSITIPEGFSPNNDPGNFNNTFIVTGLDLPNQDAELKIVNGAGAEVFSTSNIDGQTWADWDGKNAKGFDLPEGTYYYLLKLTSKGPEHQVFKKSGFIILKRY